MSPEERELIGGVFERMRSVGSIEKDREAETFINSSVRQIPDSAYMLVQSVLVQEQALQRADDRIRDLEDQLNQMSADLEAARKSGASSSGGSFLGGLFGGSKPAPTPPAASPWGSSVPSTGRQTTGFNGPAQSSQPWANQAPQQGGYNQAPIQQPQAASGGGGGFMKQAMVTATGVAGGMLVAGAIGNMMKGNSEGGSHHSSGDRGYASTEPTYQESNSNDQGGTYAQNTEPSYQDASSNDQGGGVAQDAGYDDGGSDWGGGGGDIET